MRYEKGRKDTSRRRIMEVASRTLSGDGIAASGLASIMSEAGLTNGAFYPHFESKAELVRESVAAALEDQTKQLQEMPWPPGALNWRLRRICRRSTGIIRRRVHICRALAGARASAVRDTQSFCRGLDDSGRKMAAALPPETRDRRVPSWRSLRRSSAPFSWLAPWKGPHCRIASSQRGRMPRGR